MEIFSKRLKETLLWKGIQQKELAEMLGIEKSNITNWVKGRCFPNLELFRRLCLVLGETPNYLLGFED